MFAVKFRALTTVVLALGLGQAGWVMASTDAASDTSTAQTQRDILVMYPAGSIKEEKVADAALAETARRRANVEAQYLIDKKECNQKFFATRCLDQIKEQRRTDLAKIRSVEVEANYFKRNQRVIERDAGVKERQLDADKRAEEAAEKLAQKPPSSATAPVAQELEIPKPSDQARDNAADIANSKPAVHSAQARANQAKVAERAAKQEESIAEYQKKQLEAEQRQRDVAKRKAEKVDKEMSKKDKDAPPAETPAATKP